MGDHHPQCDCNFDTRHFKRADSCIDDAFSYTAIGYVPHRCVASIIILKFSGLTEEWMELEEETM